MPTYTAWGARDYFDRPTEPYARGGVELQAVLRGPLRPWEGASPGRPATRTLWVYAAGVVHGWSGVAGRPCEVLVLHERSAPDALTAALRRCPVLRVNLGTADVARLRRVVTLLSEPAARAGARRRLVEQHALLELCVLALASPEAQNETPDPPERYAAEVAQRARSWFAEHLGEAPGVEDAAAAVHVSAVHLRRLFARAGLQSPHAEFQRLRMERADALLRGSDAKLSAVAARLGFSGPESFQRAYRQWRGRTAGSVRREA